VELGELNWQMELGVELVDAKGVGITRGGNGRGGILHAWTTYKNCLSNRQTTNVAQF